MSTKPPVLPVWANAGDKVQPTNGELDTGWPLSSTPPSRQRFNWILNFLANGISYLCRRGISDWDTDETYVIGDKVTSTVDGKTYRSKVNANSGHEPSVSATQWERWGFTLTELAAEYNTTVPPITATLASNLSITPGADTLINLTPSSTSNALYTWSAGTYTIEKSGYYRIRARYHITGSAGKALVRDNIVLTATGGNPAISNPNEFAVRTVDLAAFTNYGGGSITGETASEVEWIGHLTAGDTVQFRVLMYSDQASPTLTLTAGTSGLNFINFVYLGA